MTPFIFICYFSLWNHSQLQLSISSLLLGRTNLGRTSNYKVFTANCSVVSLQRHASGNYKSPWCSSRCLFPPLSYLQWRHDTVFEVLPRLVLHNYTSVNQRDQLSDLSVATKHGITLPQSSCHPNSPEMRATGTTALIPTQSNVVVCGPEHPREKGWSFPQEEQRIYKSWSELHNTPLEWAIKTAP